MSLLEGSVWQQPSQMVALLEWPAVQCAAEHIADHWVAAYLNGTERTASSSPSGKYFLLQPVLWEEPNSASGLTPH